VKKKSPSRLSKPKLERPLDCWHNGGVIEIHQYARSLQDAVKTLVGELDRNARTDWAACPIVLLYRQALEIHLKLLVGERSNFLVPPNDHITLHKTHSLRWLAQIVCQIIKKVGWEGEFKCEGVSSLADFSALVNDVEIFDPVCRAIRSSRSPNSVSDFYRTFDIFQFAAKLDALLELLDSTADALAAEWDHREESAAGAEISGEDFKPTIH
jgi:hypothetical protein